MESDQLHTLPTLPQEKKKPVHIEEAGLHVLNTRKISYTGRNWTLDFPAHNHP